LIPVGISLAFGVSHEPEPLPDVERADTCSRETTRPDGVVLRFHVIANTVEPSVSNRCFNLFAKDDARAALRDELEPDRPKVARIVPASLGAGRREGLTGATAGPDGTVVRPASQPKSVRPAADACKEVALGKSAQIIWPNNGNGAFVNFAIRDMPSLDQFAQPRRRERIEFIVVGAHSGTCAAV
jgi:hypothetical protein